jgi:hypothetical protein
MDWLEAQLGGATRSLEVQARAKYSKPCRHGGQGAQRCPPAQARDASWHSVPPSAPEPRDDVLKRRPLRWVLRQAQGASSNKRWHDVTSGITMQIFGSALSQPAGQPTHGTRRASSAAGRPARQHCQNASFLPPFFPHQQRGRSFLGSLTCIQQARTSSA